MGGVTNAQQSPVNQCIRSFSVCGSNGPRMGGNFKSGCRRSFHGVHLTKGWGLLGFHHTKGWRERNSLHFHRMQRGRVPLGFTKGGNRYIQTFFWSEGRSPELPTRK